MEVTLAIGVIALAVAVLALPLILGSWKLAWFLYVLCLVCNSLAVPIGPFSLRLDHLAIPLLISVLIVRDANVRQRPRYLLLAIAGLCAWMAFSALSSLSAPQPLSSFAVLVWIALSLVSMMTVLHSRIDPAELVRVGSIPVGILGGLSIVGWIVGQSSGVITPFVQLSPGEQLVRVTALGFEPNLAGALFCMWVFLIVYWRRRLPRSTLMIAVPIAVACVLTMTRAAWVALLVVCAAPVLSRLRNSIRIASSAAIAIVVALLFVPQAILTEWLGPLAERFSRITDFDSGTAAFRKQSWDIALSDLAASNRELLGLGTNSFTQRHTAEVASKTIDYLSNAWIAQVYDSGALGLAALCVALIALLISTPRRLESIPLFIALAVTSSFTNSLWFAFPWIAISLLDFRQPDAGKRPASLARTSSIKTGGIHA